ncbi:MAG: hypothetical protein ACTHKK_12275 [Candidatus Nitrosocosmicus sp.]
MGNPYIVTLIGTFYINIINIVNNNNNTDMKEQEKDKQNHSVQDNTESEILEQGNIYFFYRPKKNSPEVKGMDDVRRFFMVTAPETTPENKQNSSDDKNQFYRLFIIGKKSLPEIRKSEARSSERFWARVGGIFKEKKEITDELFSDEFRKGDVARPAGIGKYAIVKHQSHAELAYILENPDEPGEAQKEFGIEKEASYIISVINPKQPTPEGYPSSEESPKYPEKVLREFDKNENFVSLSKDTDFINYLNAQVILIGAREGKDSIKKELGIDIEDLTSTKTKDIFKELNIKKGQIPTRSLTEGKLE